MISNPLDQADKSTGKEKTRFVLKSDADHINGASPW